MNTEQRTPSLQVFLEGDCLFSNEGRWLHPLFELEEFLAHNGTDPAQLELRDRIIGKAAAILITRMGITRVYGELMSDLAIAYLENSGSSYDYGRRVPRIECRTEELFAEEDDPDTVYTELLRRAGRA